MEASKPQPLELVLNCGHISLSPFLDFISFILDWVLGLQSGLGLTFFQLNTDVWSRIEIQIKERSITRIEIWGLQLTDQGRKPFGRNRVYAGAVILHRPANARALLA